MSIAPHTGIVDFGTFTAPTASTDGIQGEVPQPLAGQEGYVLTGTGWASAGSVGLVGYQGTWNALTNTPTLTSSVGTQGYYYVVNVAGTTNLNGITDWQVGDWAIFNGSVWQKVDNTDSYDPANVAITGGTIDNTTIGATTPSTGVFTTLTAQNETLKGSGQNLILRSQALTTTPWVTNQSPTTVSFTDPLGGSTATQFTTSLLNSGVYQFFTVGNAITVTWSLYVKYVSGDANVRIGLEAPPNSTLTLNCLTGVIASTGAGLIASGSINAGNGWYRVFGTCVTTSASAAVVIYSNSTNASSFAAWGTQTEIGSTANTYIPTTTTAVYGTPTLSFSGVASIGLQSDGSLYETSAGTGNVRFYTNNIGQEQARVSHTASAVNYVQVNGAATGSGVAVSAQGSDSNIRFNLSSKGSGGLGFYTNNFATTGLNVANTASGVNYYQVASSATGFGPVLSAQGTDTNIDLNLTTKGTGVLNLNTGSGTQVRIIDSGGTAVNRIHLQGQGTGFLPVIASRGSDTNLGMSYSTQGTGGHDFYTAGTNFTQQVKIAHTASAVNYVQVTGAATGSGPTLSAQGSDTNVNFNVATKGTGSTQISTPTGVGGTAGNSQNIFNILGFSGNTVILRGSLNRHTTGADWTGTGYRLGHVVDTTPMSYIEFNPVGQAQGLSVNVANAQPFQVKTSSGEQLRVSNTASAVNYVQVTGGATGNAPYFIAQGSDTNVNLWYGTKGTGYHAFFTAGNGSNVQFLIADTASAVNYVQTSGSTTGFGAKLFSAGSDTNINLVLQPKGTGALQAQQTDSTATGGNARGANAVDWSTIRDAGAYVASGSYSVLSGGRSNAATGSYSVVGGGQYNSSGGSFATQVGGFNNATGGAYSFTGSGNTNATSGQYAITIGGLLNNSQGYLNFIGGGSSNSANANAAVTTQSATMNGTTAVTLAASNANIKVGQLVTGTSIVIGSNTTPFTYVAAISGTSLTLSQAASGSSTSTLSFYTPHGVVVGGGNNQATGAYSFIGGGGDAGTAANRNVASGDWSFVGGGRSNTASAQGSVVVGGGIYAGVTFANTASGQTSFVGGGLSNTASGQGSVVSGGYANTVSGTYSSIVGGSYGTTRGLEGYTTFPAGNALLGTIGGAQASLLILAVQTTDATATVLRSSGAAAGSTNQVILPNNSAYYFRGEIVSGVTGGGNTKGFFIEGVIKRGANAASTALVGTPQVVSSFADVGAATWTIAVTADTTNGGLAVTFTGQAATTIRTVCRINTVEMTY